MKLALKKLDFLLIYLTLSFIAAGVIRKIIAGVADMVNEMPVGMDNQFTY